MDGSKRFSNIGMKYDAQMFSLKLDEDAWYHFNHSFILLSYILCTTYIIHEIHIVNTINNFSQK